MRAGRKKQLEKSWIYTSEEIEMSINITNKIIENNLKQIVSKTDFLDREQYLQARTTADLKLLKQNKRLTL